MRIFIIHNYYQSKGGEDVVFRQEADELKVWHNVETMTFKNKKGIKGLLQFLLYPWNIFATKRVMKRVEAFRPDIVHIHNMHYAIGPLLCRALYKRNFPTVLTLHNYRLLDPSATLFHNNKVFTDSIRDEFPWKSVYRKVLDNSLIKTFWTAFTYYIHKKMGTWQQVDKYLTFSNFAKELLIESSLQIRPEQIAIKPNFVKSDTSNSQVSRQDYFVYIGRFSIEKGIIPLLNAFAQTTYQLKLFGDGPLVTTVEHYAAQHKSIEYGGFQEKPLLEKILRESQALIVPSLWFEGMPMTVLEAFANGTPVIASDIGILSEMVQDGVYGLHFEPHNEKSLVETIHKWMSLPQSTKEEISENCQKIYLDKYSPQKNVLLLEHIYKETIKR